VRCDDASNWLFAEARWKSNEVEEQWAEEIAQRFDLVDVGEILAREREGERAFGLGTREVASPRKVQAQIEESGLET
jgi:hypothetical protein